MRLRTVMIGSGIALFVAFSVSAGKRPFTITTLVLEGDDVPGIGQVTSIDAVTINDAGQWLVEVDTSFANADLDGAVLGPRGVFVREGDALAAPAGASIGSFDSVWLGEDGNVAWNLFLDGTPTNADSGLFFNTDLILQESTFSMASGLSAMTPYIGFFETRATTGGEFFCVASVDDPAIASTVDRALVWFDHDPVGGGYTETLLAKEGDVLPGVADAATDFGTGPESFAVNLGGQALFTVALSGAAATNGALYLDNTLIARKGDESPVAGLFYSNLGTNSRVDVNNRGDFAFGTGLSGDASTNQIIVRNGAKFVQKGDAAPGLAGRTVTSFNSAPVRIADDGDVVWYGLLDGATATNQGLWKGEQLLAQKGVTTVDGLLFTSLAGTTATGGIGEGFAISRNGRFVILRGVLTGDLVGAFLIEFDEGSPADLNSDGAVDGADLGILLGAWGPCADCPATRCVGDFNGDCTVDGADLGVLLGEWG